MSLAPVVWHIQLRPISSQFPKSMSSWKKLISNPNWKRHSYIQQFMLLTLRKLRVWPAGVTLTDTWGLDTHIQQALCVCVQCVFVRHAGVLKVRFFPCQARRGRHCSCVEHFSMKPVTWNKRFFTEGGLCSPVTDKVQWMWVVLPGQLVVTSVVFWGVGL